jgi:hypothetical protein
MLVVADEKISVKYSAVESSASNLASHRKHVFVITTVFGIVWSFNCLSVREGKTVSNLSRGTLANLGVKERKKPTHFSILRKRK